MADYVPRRAEQTVRDSLSAFRVVVLHGARQTGKTTLARRIAADLGGEFVTFDRADDRAAALADPSTFLEAVGVPGVFDEIQRVGDPFVLSVKIAVDEDPRPGRFLLTGSTNFLTVPSISETLAGRVDLVTLWPLSMAERTGGGGDLVDRALTDPDRLARHRGPTPSRDDYLDMICRGGYPEAQHLDERHRRRWFTRYVETVIQREIEAAADIRRGEALSAMVRLLAATTSQELVVLQLAERLGIDRATVQVYEPWLETAFLIHRVPPWSRNLTAKVVRRPKIHMTDTGVAAALLGKDAGALRRPTDPATGPLLETFVANELATQLTWSRHPARLHHYRESNGIEVDLVVEADDGRVVAVEVKATTAPRPMDLRGLEAFRDRVDRIGDDFVCGFLLHTGTRRFSVGDRIVALPIADLWS